MSEMGIYTPGRFVVSWVGAAGARDPIALTSQVKVMRDGFERLGHEPGLLLIVVADGEVEEAAKLVMAALDEEAPSGASPEGGRDA